MTSESPNLEEFIQSFPYPVHPDRAQELYEDAQMLQQSIDRGYQPRFRETAVEVIVKQVCKDIDPDNNNPFVAAPARYAAQLALGLQPLKPIDQEEGEQ